MARIGAAKFLEPVRKRAIRAKRPSAAAGKLQGAYCCPPSALWRATHLTLDASDELIEIERFAEEIVRAEL